MRKLLFALVLCLLPTIAHAQNTTCSDRPQSDSSNACANTRFAHGAAAKFAPGGANGSVQYNNGGVFGGINPLDVPRGGTGQQTFTPNLPLVGNGTGAVGQGTRSGNTTTFGTTSGTLTSGNCAQFDANGNIVDAGAACGAGSGAPYVMPSDFGITCDGTTDWHTQLQAMINASAGKTIYIPPGPACVSSVTLTIPSNIAITGGGRDVSVLKSSALPVLSITNRSNISLTNFQILGTNAATQWTTSQVGAISLTQDASSTSAGSNFNIGGMKFSGFNTAYWVYISTQGSTFALSNVNISNNQFISVAANIPTDPNHVNNTNYFLTLYSNTAGNGRIENLNINNNYMDANSMCFGIQNFANTYKFRINNNTILNPGVTAPTNHCTNGLSATNAYGISVYDLNADGNPAKDGLVSGNYILNAQASGIYWAGNSASFTEAGNGANSVISNNLIDNQTSSDNFLNRGAIAVNTSTDLAIVGNSSYNSLQCISLNAQNAGTISVLSNHCQSGAGTSIGLQLNVGTNGSSNADDRVIQGNTFNADTAVVLSSTSTNKFNSIELSSNNLVGRVNQLSAASQYFIGYFSILNNTMSGAGTASLSTSSGGLSMINNKGLYFTRATVPSASIYSNAYITDGTPGTSSCTAGGTGSMAIWQSSTWKCL